MRNLSYPVSTSPWLLGDPGFRKIWLGQGFMPPTFPPPPLPPATEQAYQDAYDEYIDAKEAAEQAGQNLGELYVEYNKKLNEISDQLSKETDPGKIQELNEKIEDLYKEWIKENKERKSKKEDLEEKAKKAYEKYKLIEGLTETPSKGTLVTPETFMLPEPEPPKYQPTPTEPVRPRPPHSGAASSTSENRSPATRKTSRSHGRLEDRRMSSRDI